MREMEIIEHRQIPGLSVFLNTVDYRTAHVHPEWELVLVLDCPLSVTCAQANFVVQPGQMVLFNPNEPHEFQKLEGSTTFLCLQIASAVLPMKQQIVMDSRLPHESMTDEVYQEIKGKLTRIAIAYLERTENCALYCVGECCLLMYGFLSRLPCHVLTEEEANAIGKRNTRLNRLLEFVDENYMHKIRLTDFASAEGCSMTYLSHFIKSVMNQTFQEYVNSVRFHRACELMEDENRKLLDICMESGFSDYRYFSRAFRLRYDMTPEEYRCYARKTQLESAVVRRSIHSMERFYTREESLKLLKQYT